MKECMEMFDIFQEKFKQYGDMSKYINFCLKHATEFSKGITQRHHILPKCLYPEYKDFKQNAWNIVNLTNEDHYIAHYLLAKMIGHSSLISAWYAMNNKNFSDTNVPLKLIGAKKYAEMIKIRNEMCSKRCKNKVIAKDLTTGKFLRVTKEEFYSNPNLVGSTTGKTNKHWKGKGLTTMINLETGKIESVNPKEIDKSKYVGATKGKTLYKDKDGKKVFTRTDDPRVLSGELVSYMIGLHCKHKPFIRKPKIKYIIKNLEDNTSIEIFKNKNFKEYIKKNNIDLRRKNNLKIDVYRFKNNEWRMKEC